MACGWERVLCVVALVAVGAALPTSQPTAQLSDKGSEHAVATQVDQPATNKPIASTNGNDTHPTTPAPSARKKRCVFMHGIGNAVVGPPSSTFALWGNVEDYTPQCSERVFLRLDTRRHAWFDRELYEPLCEAASDGKSDGVIRNTILFTYSMGTAITAAGINAGRCSLDASSSWNVVGFVSPSKRDMGGTRRLYELVQNARSNKLVMETLRGFAHVPGPNGVAPDVLANDDCTDFSRAVVCMAELPGCTGAPDAKTREAVKSIIQSQVSAVSCGSDALGQATDIGLLLKLVSMLWTTEPSDGVVPTDVCTRIFEGTPRANVQFADDPKAPFFTSPSNHFDIVCAEGNDHRPCDWFGFRT